MKVCRKCSSENFGTWTSASSGKVYFYCRACRQVRASQYSQRKQKNGGVHTKSQWLELLAQYDHCPGCNRAWADVPLRPDRRYRAVWTKDHVVPLTRGGTDDITNLQPLCYQCNSSKCGGR